MGCIKPGLCQLAGGLPNIFKSLVPVYKKCEILSKERLDQDHLYPSGEHPGRQTLFMPPTGIKLGLPASQAGTQPKGAT